MYFHLTFKEPTHTTELNWIHKFGYYLLTKKKSISDDWIIILDHSIQLGNEKIFLVYGIQESKVNFKKPISFQDLTPLLVRIQTKATGDIVKKEIEELEKQIGKIKYAVADHGSNIKNGLEKLGIPHIHDITHAIALIFQKIYKNNDVFISYSQEMAELRNKISQTDDAVIMPPKPRSKSRFHNIDKISKWGIKILNYLEREKNIDKLLFEKLSWVHKYENLIKELFLLNKTMCKIQKILKTNGLSESTINKCNQLLKKLKTNNGKIFIEKLTEYFDKYKKLLPGTENILCTSDIIESAFGKYKNYVSKNPMAGISNLVLCLVAFTSSFKDQEIIEALETTPIKKIIDWSKKEIGDTLFKRRKMIFNDI